MDQDDERYDTLPPIVLTIRKIQLDALEHERERVTATRYIEYVYQVLPKQCAQLGHEKVKESAGLAIEKAKSYRLYTDKQVLQFLDVMYRLGFDFDRDPRYPWAKEILSSSSLNGDAKMERLKKSALDALHL